MIVGMVSTRFAGLDGVSLEARKWADVLQRAGHEVVWFAGELGLEFAPGTEQPPAHFETPGARRLSAAFFSGDPPPGTIEEIEAAAAELRAALDRFVAAFGVELVLPQNVLAIPMQLSLGLAVAGAIRDTPIRAVAHHHDFWWERERFSRPASPELLDQAFPPVVLGLSQVVISTVARDELLRRRGVAATVIPNVMDFEHPPAPGDGGAFRAYCGVPAGRHLLLQPTRVVPRKSIETTLELAARLPGAPVVVVGHAEGDEPETFAGHASYGAFLRAEAARLGADLRFRPVGGPGEPSLADSYAGADLVAYPSTIEGFGNALLEAFYHRRPVLVRRYPVYVSDIAPTGVDCIEIDDELTDAAVDQAAAWLADPGSWAGPVEANYRAGREHFSQAVLRNRLLPLVEGG